MICEPSPGSAVKGRLQTLWLSDFNYDKECSYRNVLLENLIQLLIPKGSDFQNEVQNV